MPTSTTREAPATARHHFRFHEPHAHLASAFGDDWFGVRAEGFARFFGTPTFLRAVRPGDHLDRPQCRRFRPLRPLSVHSPEPRLQPAGGVCGTADRDKAHADADAIHREALAQASIERQELAAKQSAQIIALVEQNTTLTQITQELSQGIK